MTQNEREEQVALFADPSSKAAILVGTTVIEVGIDIPNTNILIVEDADRFGLSQLHQLRGRIGRAGSRSDLKCSCILLSNIITTKNQDGPAPSLTRLQILQKSNKGEEIADADFFLRGPGDMLGVLQSGIKDGLTVDLDNHWHLLDAATRLGRRFLQRPTQGNEKDMLREESASITGTTIMNWLDERDATFYERTSAATKEGLALRIMMALFAERRSDECNTIKEINTLQKLDDAKGGEQLQEDEIIHSKIVEAVSSNDWKDIQKKNVKRSDTHRAQTGVEEQVLPLKPYLALNTHVKRVNLTNDDVMFVVLDCETTGLDDKSCHIIQLAAKVLGSDDEKDLFSGKHLIFIFLLP
jgi:superfamily II DNA/RNA helicase